jgi:hypothetical protein
MNAGLRLVLLVLLLGNVAFLAWSRYFSGSGVSVENHLMQQQINREAIRLLPPDKVAALTAQAACVEWGGMSAVDAIKAEEVLGSLLPDAKVTQRRVEESASYWVYFPPAANRQAAQLKTGELKRLGIEDFFIVQDDPKFRFAISLGIFRSEEAAKKRLEALRTQGVKTALVGPRASQVQLVYFQLRNLPEGVNARLADLRRALPAAELKGCNSGGTDAAGKADPAGRA